MKNYNILNHNTNMSKSDFSDIVLIINSINKKMSPNP